MSWFDYIINNKEQVLDLAFEHLSLTALAVLIAVLIGVPLGILISYYRKSSGVVIGTASLVQAIPSMALLGLAIPFLGIGGLPAVVIVIVYSLLPIVKNTFTGLSSIDKDILEAAQAIGLTRAQILFKIQMPLALPIIMAGIRISAVTAVGLMTMAAFIGAGGLGFLVFSGISTTNNAQILAGAIPAALLALLVDYLFNNIEKLATPVSLQITPKTSKEDLQSQRKLQKMIVGGTVGLILLVVGSRFIGNLPKEGETITVGGKDFTEQFIVVHLMADMIEDRTDLNVNRQDNLGGTQVAFNALKTKDIDLYLEYTGTIYGDTLGYEPNSDMNEVYEISKKDLKEKFDIDVLNQFQFNNTFALSVPQDLADEYGLEQISDLKPIANQLTLGAGLEFLNRKDGLIGLKEVYNLSFKEEIGINGANKYLAIDNGEVDIIDAFSTDGLLKKFNLITLEDDQSFFPPYYAVPILRSGLLEEYPELVDILDELGTILTDEVMMDLNYRVDELQEKPEAVANSFLIEQGLIEE